MRPRYDVLQGGLMLVLVAGLLALLGVPRTPPLAASIALFVADGVFGLAAGLRPERRVAGYRVDFVVLRGLGTCCLGLGMLLLGANRAGGGDPFGLAIGAGGLFMCVFGVGTLLRRPTFVPEIRGA